MIWTDSRDGIQKVVLCFAVTGSKFKLNIFDETLKWIKVSFSKQFI